MTFFRSKKATAESDKIRQKSAPSICISDMMYRHAPTFFKKSISLNRASSELNFTDNPSIIQSGVTEPIKQEHPEVIIASSPVYDWMKLNCLVKEFQRTRLLRDIKASASMWWNRGVVGAEMEQTSRNVVYDWAKSIDSLSKCADVVADNHVPNSIWSLPEWAIDTFPVHKMFLSVQSHVERHFGLKLDNTITYSVAGILSSEEYISSSSINVEQSDDVSWKDVPPPPFKESNRNSETSVRMYVCVYSGAKQSNDFLRFFGARSLCSKENDVSNTGALTIECPSWYSVLSWSDHPAQVRLDKTELNNKEFWIIALDASKVRRGVKFSEVDLLECEQLVRESGADFQLYLGQLEDRRRERLSCYEEHRFALRSHSSLEAKSPQDVNNLINQGIAKLVLPSPEARNTKTFPKPVTNEEEEEDEEEYQTKFQSVKTEKIRTRSNTGFVLGDGLADLAEDEEVTNQLNTEDEEDEEGDDDTSSLERRIQTDDANDVVASNGEGEEREAVRTTENGGD